MRPNTNNEFKDYTGSYLTKYSKFKHDQLLDHGFGFAIITKEKVLGGDESFYFEGTKTDDSDGFTTNMHVERYNNKLPALVSDAYDISLSFKETPVGISAVSDIPNEEQLRVDMIPISEGVRLTEENYSNNLDLGNRLHLIITVTIGNMMHQSEQATLTASAFEHYSGHVTQTNQTDYKLQYPVGINPNQEVELEERQYSKEEILNRLGSLSNHQLAISGTYNLCTFMESMFSDLLREIFANYPKMLGESKKISLGSITDAVSKEELIASVIEQELIGLAHMSLYEFAKEVDSKISINLLECPNFTNYIEIKATRDVHIHNSGIANKQYTDKARTLARAEIGERLEVNQNYLLYAYETCLTVAEWLELKLHEKWQSSMLEDKKSKKEI